MPQVMGKDVTKREKIIERCQKDLAFLKEFILSGGGEGRCLDICIRRERFAAWRIGCACDSRGKSRRCGDITFVNRLSDALFAWHVGQPRPDGSQNTSGSVK